jgi:small subunit ribosomal protein S20
MKKYFEAVENYFSNPSEEQMHIVQGSMSAAYSKIDKAVKRGVFHRNNGARKKARLAKALKNSTAEAS